MLKQRGWLLRQGVMAAIVAVALVAMRTASNRDVTHESLIAAYERDTDDVRSILAVSGARDVRTESDVNVRTTSRLKLFSFSRDSWVDERGSEKFVAEALRRGWTQFAEALSLCRDRSEIQVDYQYRGADASRRFLLLHVREAGFSCKSIAR